MEDGRTTDANVPIAQSLNLPQRTKQRTPQPENVQARKGFENNPCSENSCSTRAARAASGISHLVALVDLYAGDNKHARIFMNPPTATWNPAPIEFISSEQVSKALAAAVQPRRGTAVWRGLKKHQLHRVAELIGLPGGIGWHTLRHTYRSWLDETGNPMKVQQELMRHASFQTKMNVYGRAMTDSKRKANSQVVGLVFGETLDVSKGDLNTAVLQ